MTEHNIEVAIRVRPPLKGDEKKPVYWKVEENEIFSDEKNERYIFDYVLDTPASNKDLYDIVQPLVHAALNGFNAIVFAYGQTSSDKTHSTLGTESDPGILLRAAKDIFSEINSDDTLKYIVRMSNVEIYNEKLQDLLDVDNKDLKIQVSDDGCGHVLLGMREEIVHDEEEMMMVIHKGSKNRHIGKTKRNEKSSPSHVICDILIESYSLECPDTPVKRGHLYIVDLARSERNAQTGATGIRMNEGGEINKSLSALISVITQLSSGQPFISYRDSKLTRLLANALGGNSRILIVAAITPVALETTSSILKFAKTMKTKPRMNEILNNKKRKNNFS